MKNIGNEILKEIYGILRNNVLTDKSVNIKGAFISDVTKNKKPVVTLTITDCNNKNHKFIIAR